MNYSPIKSPTLSSVMVQIIAQVTAKARRKRKLTASSMIRSHLRFNFSKDCKPDGKSRDSAKRKAPISEIIQIFN